jgi:hypothetical protein
MDSALKRIGARVSIETDLALAKRMHYERALAPQKEGWVPAQPAGALLQHPPESVEATESALGLLPSIALSSAQSGPILLRQNKKRIFARGSERMTLRAFSEYT